LHGYAGVVPKGETPEIAGRQIQIMNRGDDGDPFGLMEVGSQVEYFGLFCQIELLGWLVKQKSVRH
jgi:hypothetical protein